MPEAVAGHSVEKQSRDSWGRGSPSSSCPAPWGQATGALPGRQLRPHGLGGRSLMALHRTAAGRRVAVRPLTSLQAHYSQAQPQALNSALCPHPPRAVRGVTPGSHTPKRPRQWPAELAFTSAAHRMLVTIFANSPQMTREVRVLTQLSLGKPRVTQLSPRLGNDTG